MGDDAGGDVQQPVAQCLGGDLGQVAVQAELLESGEQRLGDEDELEPDLVALPVGEGQVARAGVLGIADAVLDTGVGAVAAFELDKVGVGLVGGQAGGVRRRPATAGLWTSSCASLTCLGTFARFDQ